MKVKNFNNCECCDENDDESFTELTLDGMYAESFRIEIHELKERVSKLNELCCKLEAYERENFKNKIEEPKHDCSLGLLQEQLEYMRRYLHILEIRAIVENIDI